MQSAQFLAVGLSRRFNAFSKRNSRAMFCFGISARLLFDAYGSAGIVDLKREQT